MENAQAVTRSELASLKSLLRKAEEGVETLRNALAQIENCERPDSTGPTKDEEPSSDTESDAAPGAGNRLIPLVDWPHFHPWPRLGGLRHLVLHASTNGFDQVIRKIGNRVLIDEAAFFVWASSHAPRRAASLEARTLSKTCRRLSRSTREAGA